MKERSVEKMVRVFVPASQMKELFPEGGSDGVADYILGINTEDVIAALLEGGLVDERDNIAVTFVPSENVSKKSMSRPIKYIEIYRDENGAVVDAYVESQIIDFWVDKSN